MTNYWLFKSEPTCYSLDDLKQDKKTHWDGVRNYQARNFLRDEIKKGDLVIYYHSNAGKETGAVGVAEVVRAGYPDHTALDPKSDHPDPKHTEDKPLWYMVDIKYKSRFKNPVLLSDMRTVAALDDMQLLQRGNRLSVLPVSKKHFDTVVKMGG